MDDEANINDFKDYQRPDNSNSFVYDKICPTCHHWLHIKGDYKNPRYDCPRCKNSFTYEEIITLQAKTFESIVGHLIKTVPLLEKKVKELRELHKQDPKRYKEKFKRARRELRRDRDVALPNIKRWGNENARSK